MNNERTTDTTFADLGFPAPQDEVDKLVLEIIGPIFHLIEDANNLQAWRQATADAIRRTMVFSDDATNNRLFAAFLLGSQLQHAVDVELMPALVRKDHEPHFVGLCREIAEGRATIVGGAVNPSMKPLPEFSLEEERIVEQHCTSMMVSAMEQLKNETEMKP